MSNPHALFHCNLVQLSEVVCLGHILWLCLAIVVQERRVVVWNAFFIFNIAKRMEQILVQRLGILELFRQEVFEVAIRAAFARLVDLVALGAHGHHLIDALVYHSAFEARHAQDKLEKFSQLHFLVLQNILESEKVDRLVGVFCDIDPVLEPLSISMRGPFLEVLPVG